jgi:predicted HTH transcriptional regulator
MGEQSDDLLLTSHESATIDFKREFDPTSPPGWCELVKDVVAMANSGGGTILIGVNDDGSPSGCDITTALALPELP